MAEVKPNEIVDLILEKRGIKTTARRKFLNPDYESDSHDPFMLPDMPKAVARISKAIKHKERIFIYGDYDIDGLCASVVLKDALKSFGAEVDVFIPDRFTEGYGLSKAALSKLRKQGAQLIITVDCGTKSIDEIRHANKVGLDIIVTDHHEPSEQIPDQAVAVVNPKLAKSKYPFKEIAGCGVAFKLVQALQTKLSGLPQGQEKWLLDLVAFGTVCDIVPLIDENRMMVKFGLKVWANTKRPGLRALLRITNQEGKFINARSLGFIYGPRLNAAGRLVHAKHSLDLLLSDSDESADLLAQKLEAFNSKRRVIQDKIMESAVEQLGAKPEDRVIVLANSEWDQGVIGIVASKLMETYQRPVFIMQILAEKAKGSARSFGDFNVAQALNAVKDLTSKGGGHAAAGGFTLPTKNIEKFKSELNSYYQNLAIDNQARYFEHIIDFELNQLKQANLALAEALEVLEPYGNANPEPIFSISGFKVVSQRNVGLKGGHLQLKLADSSAAISAIMFGQAKLIDNTDKIRIYAKININEWQGQKSAQLQIIKAF